MKTRLRIKAKQQPDATWKAWSGDTRLVVYAKTKVKAVDIVKMILEDRKRPRSRTLMLHTRKNGRKYNS